MKPEDILSLQDAIANFRVMDQHLVRGAQPDLAAWPLLAQLGVEAVINLRNDPLPMESGAVAQAGMSYASFPMNGLGRPRTEEVNTILDAILSHRGMVYVHCEHGNDRTGTICACYRIRVYRWSNSAALTEAEADGMAFMQFLMKDFIEDFKP